MIQLIDKQCGIFRLNIYGVDASFIAKGLLLYTNTLKPLPTKLKGSTIGWNIAGRFVSYNQVKQTILNEKM